jgi:hypothetical protein
MFATSNAAWTIWADKVLGIAVEHPSSGWHARHIENWPQDPEETAASSSRTWTASSSTAITAKTSAETYAAPYAGPGQLRPLQELSPEG